MNSAHMAPRFISFIIDRDQRLSGTENPGDDAKVHVISIFENIRNIALMPNKISHARVIFSTHKQKYPIDGGTILTLPYLTHSKCMTNSTN